MTDSLMSSAIRTSLSSSQFRGVVLLFNAVSKAQRTQQEAAAAAGKGKANAKATREAFLAQLKQQQQQQQAGAAAQVLCSKNGGA
eukprot:1159733-Pelagomonas_calceolata.AAC.9